MSRKLLLLSVLLAFTLMATLGCSSSSEASAEVLDQAVVVQDAAYDFVDVLNSGSTFDEIGAAHGELDEALASFEEMGGDTEMSAYHEAITTWRTKVDEIGESDSDVMLARTLEEMEEAMDTAKAALDTALDVADE